MSDNDQYLFAVAGRIEDAIVQFAADRVGDHFYADDLRNYVSAKCGVTAPASADRILRLLRHQGRVKYRVAHRGKSLYVIDEVTA